MDSSIRGEIKERKIERERQKKENNLSVCLANIELTDPSS